MGLEHLHGRIITAALGIPSCGCASGNGFGDETLENKGRNRDYGLPTATLRFNCT